MKSKLVKELKELGIRKIAGVKIEKINFYSLCGYYKRIVVNHEEIK